MWYNQIMFYDYEKGVSTDENERILDFCQVNSVIELFFCRNMLFRLSGRHLKKLEFQLWKEDLISWFTFYLIMVGIVF